MSAGEERTSGGPIGKLAGRAKEAVGAAKRARKEGEGPGS
jgi:hypothetical protein